MIRHGQRADQGTLEDRKSVSNPYDPHLTDIGRIQSFLTGQHLCKEIPDVKNKRLMLICSPYLRCLQTAENLVSGLQQTNISLYENTMFVEDALRERQNPKFTINDYNELAFFKEQNLTFLDCSYNKLKIFENLACSSAVVSETEEQAFSRIRSLTSKLKAFIQEKENEDIVPILITHGICVSFVYKEFTTENNRRYIFCSTSKLIIDSRSENLETAFIDKALY